MAYLINFCVCVGSNVLLTKSFKQADTLVNVTVGIVKDMIHVKNETPAKNLSIYFITDFDHTYTEELFLEMIHTSMSGYQ